jgi:hypothetical protein
MSKNREHLNELIEQMDEDIYEHLRLIGEEADRLGTSINVQLGPSYENLHYVNAQMMNDYGWIASDLTNLGIEKGDWITSNQMEY